MNKQFLLGVVALVLAGCGKPVPQCNAVAEATRRRFMGGGTPYTQAQAPAPEGSAALDKAP